MLVLMIESELDHHSGCWMIGRWALSVGRWAFLLKNCPCFMLRSKKFRPFEKVILVAIAFLLVGTSVAGAFLLSSCGGDLGLQCQCSILAIFISAARRGKPL
jgi:hypothetical protein